MELKTLRDLEKLSIKNISGGFVSDEQLKAEAVKWYKKMTCTREDWLLFFGITWEDLR